jgi:hypothetical protein
MKTWISILFTLGLLFVCTVISALSDFNIIWTMMLGTVFWAVSDSSKIQLKRYKSGISYEPVALFFAIALLWIIGFPWYLSIRYKIKTGTAVLKDECKSIAAPYPRQTSSRRPACFMPEVWRSPSCI